MRLPDAAIRAASSARKGKLELFEVAAPHLADFHRPFRARFAPPQNSGVRGPCGV